MFIYNDSNLFSLSLSASTFDGLDIPRLADHLNDRYVQVVSHLKGCPKVRFKSKLAYHYLWRILTSAGLWDVIVSAYKFIFAIFKEMKTFLQNANCTKHDLKSAV